MSTARRLALGLLAGLVSFPGGFAAAAPPSAEAWESSAVLKGETAWNGLLAFSPDGKLLAVATGGFDVKAKKPAPNEVWVWDVARREVLHTLKGHDQALLGLTFLAGGKKLVSVDREGKVKWWSSSEGKELDGASLEGIASRVTFLPNGKTMVVTVERGARPPRRVEVEVDDVETGKKTDTLPRFATDAAAFSPDLKLVLTNKGTLDLSTGGAPVGDLRMKTELKLAELGTQREVASLAKQPVGFPMFSPDGKTVVFTTYDPAARRTHLHVWNVATKKPKGERLTIAATNLYGLTFSPDGKLLVAGTEDGLVRVWDAAGPKAVASLKGHTGQVRAAAVSPDGSLIASVGADNTVRLWARKKAE